MVLPFPHLRAEFCNSPVVVFGLSCNFGFQFNQITIGQIIIARIKTKVRYCDKQHAALQCMLIEHKGTTNQPQTNAELLG